MSSQPAAFLTYVRLDDEHEDGGLTELCKRLGGEIRVQTGAPFRIFQDRGDIAWGQQWKERIDESLDAVTFLIAMITPGFFKSTECRKEVERFLAREKELGRRDLILPVYYVNTPALNDEAKRKNDPLMQVIASRQYADWRDMRFKPWTSPQVRKTIAAMARQIGEALERTLVQPATPVSAATQQSTARQPQLAPKIEPPTRIVDPLHRGHHATLTEALQAAKPGDRIVVRPGLYAESVVIDKPVEIIGEGDRSDIVIESESAPAISFRSTMGRVANLTLRRGSGGSPHFCVDISQGRVDLEDCDISSQSLASVGIHAGADPRLRRNVIHDGKAAGVFIYENGRGTLEDNDIFGNALAGVEIKDSAPMVRRNRLHDGKAGGIVIRGNVRGTIEDNDIFANGSSGVEIDEGGDPIVRRNRIHASKQDGVVVYKNGRGTIEDNNIFANGLNGLEIQEGGDPIVRRNRIHASKQNGVVMYKNGRGTIEDNDIFANGLNGVEIQEGGDPIVRRNRIHGSKHGGIVVREKGRGTIEDNDIFANELSGLIITTGGNPDVRRNKIRDGKQAGIYVNDGGQGTLEKNEIIGNNAEGVFVATGGNPTVQGNRITGNGFHGVVILNGGGVFERNDLRDNGKGAWFIDEAAARNVTRKDNQE